MTIERHLRRRYLLLFWIGMAGAAVIMILVIRGSGHVRGEYHPRDILGFLLALGFAFLVMAQLRCPRCRRTLFWRWKPGAAPRCPHCGASFDEPDRP